MLNEMVIHFNIIESFCTTIFSPCFSIELEKGKLLNPNKEPEQLPEGSRLKQELDPIAAAEVVEMSPNEENWLKILPDVEVLLLNLGKFSPPS